MRLKLSLYLEQLVEYCWLLVAITLPIAFNPWGSCLFELPKSLVLSTIAALLITCFLLHMILTGRSRFPDPFLLWTTLGYCLSAVAATVLATSFQDSLVGTYGRRQGLFIVLSYPVLMWGAALYFRDMKQVRRLLKTLVWTSLPLCVFGLMQSVGFNPFDWVTDSDSSVMATLGRSNFFGAYLVLLIPLTLALLFTAKHRWPLGILLACQLLCLVFTHAHSSWIGLAMAGLTWLILRRTQPVSKSRCPCLLSVLLLAVAIYVVTSFLAGPYRFEPPIGFAQINEMLLARGGSEAARLTIWKRTVELLLESPWLGYGFDSMEPVFSRSFPPELVYYQGRQVMVDRAHNLWLDIGMNSGLLGIATLSILLVLVGRRIYHGLLTTDDQELRFIWLGLAAALAGHLTDLQFSFDLTATAALFWLLLGIAFALARGMPGSIQAQDNSAFFHPALGVVWLLLFSVFFTAWPLQALQADRLYARAQQDGRTLDERKKDMEQAINLNPHFVDYHLYQARLIGFGDTPEAADKNIQVALQLRPNDPWIMVVSGNLYARLGKNSPHYLHRAEQDYRKVIEMAPDIGPFHTALAQILFMQGRRSPVLAELKEALRLDETDWVAYALLARLHELLGNPALARKAHQQTEYWYRHDHSKQEPNIPVRSPFIEKITRILGVRSGS